MLSISNVCKRYKTRNKNVLPALNDINLKLEKGVFGLLGPNGAGKSSLMRTLATLQHADSGNIHFDGQDIEKNPAFMRRRLGYLPQEYGVYPEVSALALLDYMAKLKGIYSAKQRKAQIEELLLKVNLSEHQHQAVSNYSGGMKQRFGIAQALLGEPEMLIVDEPTAGLDPEERNRFHNLLVELSKDKVVLLSTHIVDDVRQICAQMAIMQAGNIVRRGAPEDIVDEFRGKIWRLEDNLTPFANLAEEFTVISHRLLAGKRTLHVLSDEPMGQGWTPIKPDLEDAYFAVLSENGGLL